MELTLPFPPSVNHYYRRVGPRTLISREGRAFRKEVCARLGGGGPRKPPAGGRIALAMDAFPPDRRRRDLDNLLKCTQDSLSHAGVFEDDSQIDLLAVRRCEVVHGGTVVIRVAEMPLRRCPLCGHPKNPEGN
ncbi:MAG: RusA family crossover junction endodeoxyribonuclease [Planctomycetota bacterium]